MEINNLSKEQLLQLKQNIDNRLQTIEVKNIKPEKGSIMALEKGDKIFSISLSFGGHKMAEPKELEGEVDIIDYSYITGIDLCGNEDYFRISISHPTKPFGISTPLSKILYKNEHCYLNTDTMKTGYDGFYTLRPENWEQDLIRMFNIESEERKGFLQKDLDLLQAKLQLFIDAKNQINEHI